MELQRRESLGFHSEIWYSGISGRSVPLSGLPRPMAVRPLQKIGWRKSGSLPDITQSYRRLSQLNVTQTSGIMRSPSHYTPEMTSGTELQLIRSLSSFRQIDPASTTLGSTKSGITGRSVPLSGLPRSRTVRPLQKIGWRKSGSLPNLYQPKVPTLAFILVRVVI